MKDKFKKEQIIRAEKYSNVRDVLSALLKNDVEYTLSDVDKVVKEFNEKVFTKSKEEEK